MARVKYDGIIEAVRYLPGGKIAAVRAYERRGSIWSDSILLERKDLLEKIEMGKKFITGQRMPFMGSMFETSHLLHQVQGYIVLEGLPAEHDNLPGIPVF